VARGPDLKARGVRKIYLGVWMDAPVFAFSELPAGQLITGPALIEADTTTVLLRAADTALVTDTGWLDIAISD
jgi:N-methylhydantoinase A